MPIDFNSESISQLFTISLPEIIYNILRYEHKIYTKIHQSYSDAKLRTNFELTAINEKIRGVTPKIWSTDRFFLVAYCLPHIILFLGHGGDFVGYLLGGEFDIVHECLLCLVAADMHHLEDGVPVAEIHIGDAGASGGVACHTLIARHNHVAVEVGLRFLLLFLNASFCFIVSLVGTFSFSDGSCSDRSLRISFMYRFSTCSLAFGML